MATAMDSSKFAMWRACMAILHLDGIVTAKEKAWAQDRIKALPLSDDQRKILTGDLASSPDVSTFMSEITRPADRAFLLHMIRTLGHLDGDFSAQEQKSYKALEEAILGKINLKAHEEHAHAMEHNSYHEDEVYKVHNKASLFEAFSNSLLKWANGGTHKFPKK